VNGNNKVLDRIHDAAELLAERAESSERLGRLDDNTVALMREIGIVKMLQPAEWGGMQAHPCEFLESVMAMGAHCGATAWVSGVVGVHPWEVGLLDPRLGNEIWSRDPDVWIASPYAPMGRARAVDGGWVLNGRWEFSSGTDHCDWVVLGALRVDENSEPGEQPATLHLFLPRPDYEIVPDSWDVYGLRGTGSKDIVVRDAFVPDYRAVEGDAVMDGRAARERGRGEAIYLMPWSAIFPMAISSAVVGICEGGLAACANHHSRRARVPVDALTSLGEAASEIDACRTQLLSRVAAIYDLVDRGEEVPIQMRADARRDQVRCSWRAVSALDDAFARTGGAGIRMNTPMQRFWRDAHAGLHHAINVVGPTYRTSALARRGVVPPAGAFV
jgi:alkylation response protein AidB-like acyl-CoA dehydrogenase